MENNRSIRDALSDNLVQGFDKTTNVIGSHTSEIMGDAVGGLVDDVKQLTSGAFDIIKGGMSTVFGKDNPELEEAEKQTGILDGILNIFKRQETDKALDFDKEDDSGIMIAILMTVGIAIAAALGGIVGSITLPFVILGKGLLWAFKPLIPIVKWFGSMLRSVLMLVKKLPGFGKTSKLFTKLTGWFVKLWGWFVKILPQSKYLGKIFKAFQFGFTKLAWPITIIMGVIDFIKGWTSSTGTLVDKLKSGLVSVIQGFIELPVKLLGWIADWILDKINIKINGGSSSKIMDGISLTIKKVIDSIVFSFKSITIPLKIIWKSLMWLGENTGDFDVIGSLTTYIKNEIISLYKSFISIKNKVIGFFIPMKNGIKSLYNWLGSEKGHSFIQESINSIKSYIGSMINQFKEYVNTMIINPIKGVLEWLNTGDTTLLMESFNLIKTYISGIFNNIKNMFNTYILNPIRSFVLWLDEPISFDGIVDTLKQDLMGFIDKIGQWIKEKTSSLLSNLNPLNWFKEKSKAKVIDSIPETVSTYTQRQKEKQKMYMETGINNKKSIPKSNVELSTIQKDNKIKKQEKDLLMQQEIQKKTEINSKQNNKQLINSVNQVNTTMTDNSTVQQPINIPDEIEHMGLILMNKPAMGGAF